MADILFNGKFTSQNTTGVQRMAAEMIKALDERLQADSGLLGGARTSLMCPPNARQDLRLLQIEQLRVGRLRGVAWEQVELPRHARGARLVNLCNVAPLSRRGDIVFIHDAQAFITPKSYTRAFRTWYRTALPIISRRAAKVVTVSHYAATELSNRGVVPPAKLTVIPNGVDHIMKVAPRPAAVEELGLAKRPYVVAPANLQSHKNISVLLEAFHSPRLRGVLLCLVGGATAENFVRAGHRLPPSAVFAGRAPDSDMRALIEGAAAFAFPSITEGFGLPPLEAMLLGTPAIVAPCGALPEVCGEAVLYAPPDDAETWADSIARVVEDLTLQDSLRDAGLARAQSYRWETSANLLAKLLADAPPVEH